MNELLQQVRVIDPVSETDRIADVLIADGVIKAIEDKIADNSENTEVRNCQNMVLSLGLVDLYSHTGEPGFEERETLSSLSAAALAGGFTRLTLLPNTVPPIDNPAGLAQLKQQPAQSPTPKIYFWGALTVGVEGKQMTELAELAAAGVAGFSDGQPVENLGLLRRLLEYLHPIKKPIALMPCNLQLAGNGVMREGATSMRFGLPGSPAIAESAALAALLEVVAATQTPVHIMRVSTRRSVELIQDAKNRGLPITASTTWMHLLLNTEALKSYDPSLHLNPPLGSCSDQTALIAGLREGVLDAIAIDHTPYTYEEKTVPFAEAPPGAIGLELALPLLWQNLVETNKLSALELLKFLSTKPAECLQQKPGAIAPNQPAELMLFAPQQSWTVQPSTLHSRSLNTPWLGQTLCGRILKTWN